MFNPVRCIVVFSWGIQLGLDSQETVGLDMASRTLAHIGTPLVAQSTVFPKGGKQFNF